MCYTSVNTWFKSPAPCEGVELMSPIPVLKGYERQRHRQSPEPLGQPIYHMLQKNNKKSCLKKVEDEAWDLTFTLASHTCLAHTHTCRYTHKYVHTHCTYTHKDIFLNLSHFRNNLSFFPHYFYLFHFSMSTKTELTCPAWVLNKRLLNCIDKQGSLSGWVTEGSIFATI